MNRNDWQSALGILRSLAIYWRPGRQRGLRRLYRPFLPHRALVFDVGAHLGDRSRAFAGLGARVVALEPQPQLFRWLQRLVGSRPDVILREEAVGREPGKAMLAVSRRTPTVSSLSRYWQSDLGRNNPSFGDVSWDESVLVPLVTLDQLIAEYGLPDFCKIDVEGFEAEVLAGLSQPVPALSLEFVAGALDVAVAAVQRLVALGAYEFNAIRGEQRRFLFREWLGGEAMLGWLDQGAGGLPSGDIYARLRVRGRDGTMADRQGVDALPGGCLTGAGSAGGLDR
jgi:FkbM family methyltransferase